MESASESIEELWKKAGKYYLSKQYKDAIDIYLLIKEKEPKAYRELVKCYKLNKEYANVIFICTEPLFVQKLRPDNLIDLINSYYYFDFVEGLEEFYSDHSKILPNEFQLLITGLIFLDIQQKYSEARDNLCTIQNNKSFNRIHIVPRINGASKKMNVVELTQFLEKKIIELDKNIPIKIEYAKQNKKNIQYKLDLISALQLRRNTDKDIEDSILLCNDCIKLQSDCQEAFYYLGKAYRIKGNNSEAIKNFNIALLKKSNDSLSIDTPDYTAIKDLNKKISIKIELSKLYLNNNNYTEAKNCLNDIQTINISIKQLGIIYIKEKKLDEKTERILRNKIGIVSIANLIMKLWERQKEFYHNNDAISEGSKSIKVEDVASSLNTMTTVERNSIIGEDIPIGEDGFIKNTWKKKGAYYLKKDDNYPNVVKEVNEQLDLNLLPDDDVFLKPCETKTLKINNKDMTFIYVKRCKEGNLYDFLHTKNQILSITAKINIIKQIANGLLTICSKSFTMIKLNPYNIFIDGKIKINENEEAPKIKIGDFQNVTQNNKTNAQWILQNHENIYMYSFGVLIWEILTQKEPKNQLDMTIIPDDTPLYLFHLMIALINKENYPDLLKTRDTLELFNSTESDRILEEKYFKIYKIDNAIYDKQSLNEMIKTNEISSDLLHYFAYRQEGNSLYLYTEYYETSLNEENNLIDIKKMITFIKECQNKQYIINTLDLKYIYVKSKSDLTLKLANYGKNEELLNILYPKEDNAKNIYIQLGYFVLDYKKYKYDKNKEYDDADALIEEINENNNEEEEELKSFIQLLYEDEPNIEEIQIAILKLN